MRDRLRVASWGAAVPINPDWFGQLNRSDATFVIAHELLHLALQTHDRTQGTDPTLFNIAHDYIINDMLVEALGQPIPANGLQMAGAREMSAENLVAQLKKRQEQGKSISSRSWASQQQTSSPGSTMAEALKKVGLVEDEPEPQGLESDVLPDSLEREWFPDLNPTQQSQRRKIVQSAATKAVSLGILKDKLNQLIEEAKEPPPTESDEQAVLARALKTLYRPPWELALQQWMEAVVPGDRSYARPSRRGSERADVVLAGRKREGWILHIILDTSGSMEDEFGQILGAIASFCESTNVGQLRLLQCDVEVTQDEILAPDDLQNYVISGLGGSDLSPAMWHLAQEPEVEAAIILTDGCIYYPEQPMPYEVLWVLTRENRYFNPSYGRIIVLNDGNYQHLDEDFDDLLADDLLADDLLADDLLADDEDENLDGDLGED